MGNLIKIANKPTTVAPDTPVPDIVKKMVENDMGAAVVVDNGVLAGIVTERDIIRKVIYPGKDIHAVHAWDIMNAPVKTVAPDADPAEILEIMKKNHFRHVPLVQDGRVVGILSIRYLLHQQVEELDGDMDSLVDYLGADGPGG